MDFQSAMNEYRENNDEARQALAQSDFITLPEEVYLQTGDYARPADGVVDTEGMEKMLDTLIEFGVLTEDDRIDVKSIIRPGVTAGH